MSEAQVFNKFLNIFSYCPKCYPNQEPIGSIEIVNVLYEKISDNEYLIDTSYSHKGNLYKFSFNMKYHNPVLIESASKKTTMILNIPVAIDLAMRVENLNNIFNSGFATRKSVRIAFPNSVSCLGWSGYVYCMEKHEHCTFPPYSVSQIEHENSAQSAGFLSDWIEEFSKSIENNIPSIAEKSIDSMSNRNKNVITFNLEETSKIFHDKYPVAEFPTERTEIENQIR